MIKKKVFGSVVAVLTAFTLCGCGGQSNTPTVDYSAEDATVWCAPASEKVLANASATAYDAVKTKSVVLSSAKNDYESGQILITASKDLAFTVTLGDLTDTSNAQNVIKKENFKVYTQQYMAVTRNWNGNGAPTGDYPDAIVPQEVAEEYGLNRVAAGKNGGAWLEFYIPENTPAGNYTGSAAVRIGKDQVSVPVSLKVYDVTVPSELTSKSLFSINKTQVVAHELDNSVEMVDKYADLLMQYKLSPTEICGNGTSGAEGFAEKAYRLVTEKGMTTIGLSNYGNEDVNGFDVYNSDVMAEYLVALAEKSLSTENSERQVNLLEKTAFYDWRVDEPFFISYQDGEVAAHVSNWKTTVEKTKQILTEKEEFQTEFGQELIATVEKVAHVITDYMTDEFGNAHRTAGELKNKDGSPFYYASDGSDLVNLCPKPDAYDSEEERTTYNTGREKWWYNCNDPKYPNVTYHMDDTMASAISVGWIMAQNDITGNLYWCVNSHSDGNGTLENPYNTAHRGSGANGDGFLIYPGKYYGMNEPVPSIRLDAIRDGQEDYELIKILKNVYAEKGYDATSVIKTITKNFYEGGSILGGSEEYETARELLLSLTEAATSSAQFMITSVAEKETETGRKYTIQAAAADGVKLYEGDKELTAENGLFTVTKGLGEAQNYYSVRIVDANGTERTFSLYLGGKEVVYTASAIVKEDFAGDIQAYEFADGYHKFTLAKQEGSITSDEKLRLDFTHESVTEISSTTKNYILTLYNGTQNDIGFEIQIEYEGYGLESAQIGTLKQGENQIDLNIFATMNWNNKGKVKKLRIVLTDGSEIGIGGITVYGV